MTQDYTTMNNETHYMAPQPPVNTFAPPAQQPVDFVSPASNPPHYTTPNFEKTADPSVNHTPMGQNPAAQPSAAMYGGVQGSVVPLYALSQSAAVVDCPRCSQRGLTVIDYKSGTATHAAAAFCCCMTILCTFVPYFFSGIKDVQHRCAQCHTLLATWHRSSGIEVHCPPRA